MSESRARELIASRRAEITRVATRYDSDAVAFARHALGVIPDPWQERVLRWTGGRMLLNCSRQAGKSTMSSILALHRSVFRPNHLTLLVSPSLRQSSELFRKVADNLAKMRDAPARTEDNKLSVAFQNGSRIVSLPSSEGTVRGFSGVGLIIEDESAWVDDELNAALRPMLAVSGGDLLEMSTPNGRRGHFFEHWEHGADAWERVEVWAKDVPRISPSFLAAERKELAARGLSEFFRQEYECAFVNAATGRVYAGFDPDRNVIADAPLGIETTLLGIDYGFTDETAFAVLGWRPNDPCVYGLECFKEKGLAPSEAAEVAAELERKYRHVRIVGDLGGLGKGYAEEARSRFSLPIEPADKVNKHGYIALLNGDLTRGRIKLVAPKCSALVDEWRELPWREDRQKEKEGYANHCADAFLYAWRACSAFLEQPSAPSPAPGSKAYYDAEEARLEEAALEALDGEDSPKRWWRR